jgi:hypothetical protein
MVDDPQALDDARDVQDAADVPRRADDRQPPAKRLRQPLHLDQRVQP